jgi:DDE superfamily endonuclease
VFAEKTRRQALDRTEPWLPMVKGRAATMTHDYRRNGTIDLFAALNVGTGQVPAQLRKGHTGADVLRFFKQIDAAGPADLDVHVILDNLSAHKTPEIQKWLAHKGRQRWHLHFTPTSSSWLNLVDLFARKNSPTNDYAAGYSPAWANSPTRSSPGRHAGTKTPNPSFGKPPPRTSSPKSHADAPHSTTSNRRRTTRATYATSRNPLSSVVAHHRALAARVGAAGPVRPAAGDRRQPAELLGHADLMS